MLLLLNSMSCYVFINKYLFIYKVLFAKKYKVQVKTTTHVCFLEIETDYYMFIIVKLPIMNKTIICYFLNKTIFLIF